MKKRALQWVLLLAGATLSSLTIVSFVRSAGLFPGGFSGISLLLQELCIRYLGFTPPYTVFLLGLNVVAAALSFRFIGKRFAVLSLIAVAVSGVLADVIPSIRVAEDPLLNSVFGGVVNGASATLCLFAGASLGGTDFIDQPEDIYEIIRDKTHHGATLFRGEGLFRNEPRSMIYTVVSADEVRNVVRETLKKDPHAFINTQRTDSLTGRFYRKPQE